MCRKILMHVAVDVAGSKAGKSFVDYINDLESQGYNTKGLKDVVDLIRKRGNVANHELPASSEAERRRPWQSSSTCCTASTNCRR